MTWTEPQEQILSDDEIQPIVRVWAHPRVWARSHRNRIYKYAGYWFTAYPTGDRRFSIGGQPVDRIPHPTFAEAVATFRLESAKELAKQSVAAFQQTGSVI